MVRARSCRKLLPYFLLLVSLDSFFSVHCHLQFLTDCSSRLSWTGVLNANDFDEVNNATVVIFLIFGAGKTLYLYRDSSIGFGLYGVVISCKVTASLSVPHRQ